MLKIVAIKLNTVSNTRKRSIQTLHTDLKHSTIPSTFKSISAGLTRHINETKNEEKDSNSLNASLFISAWFRIQPISHERHAHMGGRQSSRQLSGVLKAGDAWFVLLHRKCMVFT